jgi:hypothetical protein
MRILSEWGEISTIEIKKQSYCFGLNDEERIGCSVVIEEKEEQDDYDYDEFDDSYDDPFYDEDSLEKDEDF